MDINGIRKGRNRTHAGEIPIDHGEASAAPRAISRVHSDRRSGVQGRESPPTNLVAAAPPIPAALRLTGLSPFPFLCRLGPFRPNALQSGPASLPGGFSFGRALLSDPTRLSGVFFTEKSLNFPN
ncbi:hypothetical protein CRG98_020291 [Punica granatum]|uniref:Uncharacterized protein n=1 Tax=Punica granatum TaxID=22663 RepID=A0A2I0JSK2_PUNGR|nr:hypothetical protein CRG98_020291 [Punica granatum]